MGIFACDCGFIYQRVGPDQSEKTRFTYNSIKEYGKTWENTLEELWMNLSLSVAAIARILQVSDLLIVRHAIRLDLPMNQPNTRTVQGYERRRNPRETFSELLSRHRRSWSEVVERHSTSTRQELMDTANTLYLWLLRNDSDWFKQHLPDAEIKSGKTESTNWRKIDDELSKEVEQVCKEILGSRNPILRVSITEIIKRVGNQSWLEKRDKKLPKTTEVINRYSENLENFMLRKIDGIEKKFIAEKKVASRSLFIERSRLKNGTSRNSLQIQNSINAAVERIKFAVESKAIKETKK